jgi:hypothetical protein
MKLFTAGGQRADKRIDDRIALFGREYAASLINFALHFGAFIDQTGRKLDRGAVSRGKPRGGSNHTPDELDTSRT